MFLCFLFLLFFSLIGATFENARALSAQAYLRTAAHSAAMTVFGNYNRELYEQYGLFAYGGYDGRGVSDLTGEFTDVLTENLKTQPDIALNRYSDLYRITDISCCVESTQTLTQESIFSDQVFACVSESALQTVKEKLTGTGTDTSDLASLEESLATAEEFENEGSVTEEENASEKTVADTSDNGETVSENSEDSTDQDEAGGNPLTFLSDLIKDGILSLVCDNTALSAASIEPMDADTLDTADKIDTSDVKASGFFKSLLSCLSGGEEEGGGREDNGGEEKGGVLTAEKEKLSYIAYANDKFSSYVNDKGHKTKYEMEYLIAGKQEEKDNLSAVVNRLLAERTLTNFACIWADEELKEKSMATATVIAGITGMPPVIKAVQVVILLVLAFEESCVDVRALLKGYSVPAVKSSADLKMRYGEICAANAELFREKAETYANASGGMSYENYLWTLLQLTGNQKLCTRFCDLIQYNLREQVNQTFCLSNCICTSNYQITYRLPYILGGNLPYVRRSESGNTKSLEVKYGYKSG